MSGVRVLVGTRKGAFILSSDGKRESWDVQGPFFGGWEIYHVKGSPVDTNRIYASQSTGWFGQLMQRSDDGGKTWEPVSNQFLYDGVPGTHQWYDGTPHPWEFARVWHLEPSLSDPDTVLAGVEDAALFRSSDGGQSWAEIPGLRETRDRTLLAAGCRWHVPAHDRGQPGRRPADLGGDLGGRRVPHRRRRGDVVSPRTRGCIRARFPIPTPSSGTACTASPCTRRAPTRCSCRSTGTSCAATTRASRGRRSAGTCRRISASASTSTPTSPRPSTSCPSRATAQHFPPEGKLRVYRSRTGGNEWEPLTKGLPQANCYVDVLRDAMAVDSLDECGVYFGTTGGQVYASTDAGDSWKAIVHDLPAVLSVEVQTLA